MANLTLSVWEEYNIDEAWLPGHTKRSGIPYSAQVNSFHRRDGHTTAKFNLIGCNENRNFICQFQTFSRATKAEPIAHKQTKNCSPIPNF